MFLRIGCMPVWWHPHRTTSAQAGCFHTGPVSGLAARLGAKAMPSFSTLYHETGDDEFVACRQPDHGAVGW